MRGRRSHVPSRAMQSHPPTRFRTEPGNGDIRFLGLARQFLICCATMRDVAVDPNSLEVIINIGTIAFIAAFWVPLQKWLKGRMHRVTAGFAAAVIMFLCVGSIRGGYEVFRQQSPAVVDEQLTKWRVFSFLKDHEPRLYEELSAQIKARWPVQSGDLYAVGRQFWGKHGAGLLAKYGKLASDDATIGFYRLHLSVMDQLYARADSACYLFLHNDANGARLAAATVVDYNRRVDLVGGALLRSGAESPQAAPVATRVERLLEVIGARMRTKVDQKDLELVEKADLSSLVDQKRACTAYIAFLNEILNLDSASASAVLRSFW